jgi:exodeoxyribonuclease V beta subunit
MYWFSYVLLEARDLAYWMRAVLAPMDTLKVRTALALPMLNLSPEALLELNEDGQRFDQYASWMKELERVWFEQVFWP